MKVWPIIEPGGRKPIDGLELTQAERTEINNLIHEFAGRLDRSRRRKRADRFREIARVFLQ